MPTFAVVRKVDGLIENIIVAESQEVADKIVGEAYATAEISSQLSEPILGKTYDLELNILITQEDDSE